MIEVKSDKNQCHVQMTIKQDEMIQDEIVRVIASVLVSFKQQMDTFKANPKDIDRDIELMMMNAKLTYAEIKDQNHNFKTDTEEVLDDKNLRINRDKDGNIDSDDIVNQINNMLNKKKNGDKN